MEQNKTGKYFKYAIGEIVLVMIGILLALQVNNWNENRKLQKVKQQFVKTIISDMQQDSLLFLKSIKWYERDFNSIQKINNKIDNPLTTMDTIRKMARYKLFGYFNDGGVPTTGNIDALIATGNINLFTDSIQQVIISYNIFQNRFRERLKRMTEMTNSSDKYNGITSSGHPLVKSYYFQGHMRDRIWESKSDALVLEAVDYFLTNKINSNRIIFRSYNTLLKKTIEFLTIMKSLDNSK